jgi:hypothetical protein
VAKELIKIKGFEIKKPIRKTGGMLSSAYPDLYVTTKSEKFYLEKCSRARRATLLCGLFTTSFQTTLKLPYLAPYLI